MFGGSLYSADKAGSTYPDVNGFAASRTKHDIKDKPDPGPVADKPSKKLNPHPVATAAIPKYLPDGGRRKARDVASDQRVCLYRTSLSGESLIDAWCYVEGKNRDPGTRG